MVEIKDWQLHFYKGFQNNIDKGTPFLFSFCSDKRQGSTDARITCVFVCHVYLERAGLAKVPTKKWLATSFDQDSNRRLYKSP